MLSPKFDVFLRGGRKYCSSFPSFTPSPDKVCAKEEYFSEWKFKEAVTLCKMFITNEFKNMPSSSSISGKSGSSDSWSPSSTSPLLLSMKSQLKAGWIYLLDLTIIANNSPLKTAQEIITAHMYLLAIFYLMSSLSHIEDCTRKPDEMVSACRDRFRHFFSKCLLTLETVASASASSRNTRMLKIVIFVWKCISKDLSVHLSYLTSSQSSSLSSSAATTTATAAWPLEASDIVELSNKFHALWKILELKFDEDDITFSTKSNRSSCDRAGSTIKPGKKTAPEEFDEFDSVIIFKGHSILTTNTTTSTSSSTLARIPLLLELYSTTAYSKAISEERGQLVYEALQTMISLWAALHYSNFGLDRDALILSNRLVESQRITILSLLFCNNDITMRMAQSHYQGTELMHVFSRMPMGNAYRFGFNSNRPLSEPIPFSLSKRDVLTIDGILQQSCHGLRRREE